MAHLYGIRPWETDLLTVQDFDVVIETCRTYVARMTQGEGV